MIYLDACALIKFIKREPGTDALRTWRQQLPAETELLTSQLAQLEITRALLRSGVDHQRVPYIAGQAISGVYLVDLTSMVLSRAMAYRLPRLGSLNAIHLASADPFRPDLTEFITYDLELAKAASDLGFPVAGPFPEGKIAKNRVHLDIHADADQKSAEVERLLGLGAHLVETHSDRGPLTYVMRDSEGNEFCLH